MKLEFSRQIFEKSTNMKFHENLSSGKQVAPSGRTDMMKLIVTFCNFMNMHKNMTILLLLHQLTVLLDKTTNKPHDKFMKSEHIFYVVSYDMYKYTSP
jgi:hypothetical protein